MVLTIIKKLLKKIFTAGNGLTKSKLHSGNIISRHAHTISRAAINPNALKVLYRLKKAGYSAYLVGGSVRDLLLNKKPKDFDVATDARPEDVRRIFRNCRLIGRRFRLAHVFFGMEIVEVATFRAMHDAVEHCHEKGMILRDNVYGTLDEDAWRRDFTVNALYYNIADFSVVDFCGGMRDLQDRVLRIIGDARQRYHEDPVRLLRAVRFAGKLDFQIHPDTETPIAELGELLIHVSPARLYEEVIKLFLGGHSLSTFKLLHHYALLPYLFAQTVECMAKDDSDQVYKLLTHAFKNTDQRINEGKSINPAFLFAALLWHPLQKQIKAFKKKGYKGLAAQEFGINKVTSDQIKQVAIPKRLTQIMRDIWELQHNLQERRSKRVLHLLQHRRFRAAYDFLLLRAEAGEAVQEIADWWTQFQEGDEKLRQSFIEQLNLLSPPKSPKRRKKS